MYSFILAYGTFRIIKMEKFDIITDFYKELTKTIQSSETVYITTSETITFQKKTCIICGRNTFDKKKDVCSRDCARERIKRKYKK